MRGRRSTACRHATRLVVLIAWLAASKASAADDWPPQGWPEPIDDSPTFFFFITNELEYRNNRGPDTFTWDVEGWLGGDYNRLWVKSEGNQELAGSFGADIELQALYSRMVAPFWNLQVGVRRDEVLAPDGDRSRTFAVIGLEGLAPTWFEVEPALFISGEGDVSARFTGWYDFLLTQRLVAQPRIDLDLAAQEVEEFGVGRGFDQIELGLRLRYEIVREFAPYVGFAWTRKLGGSSGLARAQGERAEELAFVAGVRLWF